MPDPVSTIRHTLMLRRVDSDAGIARYYALMIERDLFGSVRLMCQWGQRLDKTTGKAADGRRAAK